MTPRIRRGGPATRRVCRASNLRGFGLVAGAILVSLVGAFSMSGSRPAVPGGRAPAFDGTLSVLTYNVKGLPWPVARGRTAKLRAIAAGLLGLRREGAGPHLVLLQEAFNTEAQAIGAESGYAYVARGPSASDLNRLPATDDDRHFLAGALCRKGETQGKLLDSGLEILSDYPIDAIRRMAWPAFACAGFDCLANKGVLFATIDVPGAPSPVDVVTAHLNSLDGSGVPAARSLYAYRRQVELLAAFIRRWHDPAHPLIVGGDFNAHESAQRRAVLLPETASWCGSQPVRDALHALAASGSPLPADARAVLRLGRDWQFFASGARARLHPVGAHVLFGPDSHGAALSDHVGYAASFRLESAAPATFAGGPARGKSGG